MGLRDLAAMHRAKVLDNPAGISEEIVVLPASGGEFYVCGNWTERPTDERREFGVGARGTIGGIATLNLSKAAVPELTRAYRFRRVSVDPDKEWVIEQIETITSVGWRVTLSKLDKTRAKGAR